MDPGESEYFVKLFHREDGGHEYSIPCSTYQYQSGKARYRIHGKGEVRGGEVHPGVNRQVEQSLCIQYYVHYVLSSRVEIPCRYSN